MGFLMKPRLPKQVQFTGFRLSLLYSLVLYLGVLGVICWALYGQVWYQHYEFTDIITSSWASLNTTRAEASMKGKLNQSFCTDGIYDYQYDVAGQWLFEESRCKPLCDPLVVDTTCFVHSDLAVQRLSGVFFVTAMTETYIQKTAAEADAMVQSRASYIIPLEAEYTMVFSYAYAVSELETRKVTQFPTDFRGTSARSLTILLDHQDRQIRTYMENDIALSLMEILRIAGEPNVLEIPQPDIGQNLLPNARFKHLPARVTGRQIQVQVLCHSYGDLPKFVDPGDWRGNVCTMKIYASAASWEVERSIDAIYGITRVAQKYGVYVHVRSKAVMRLIDAPRIIAFITQALVLLGLLSKVFRLFITMCLGHLSTIYSHAICEDVNVDCMMANLGMDMLCANLHFNHLKEENDAIPMGTLLQSFKQSFRGFNGMNDNEIEMLALHSFAMANSMHSHGLTTGTNDLPQIYDGLCSSGGNSKDTPTALMRHNFLLSTQVAKIPLEAALKIFEQDGRMGLLESAFAPVFMRTYHKKKHHIFAERRCDEDREDPAEASSMSSMSNTMSQKDTPIEVEDANIRKYLVEFETKIEGRLQELSKEIRLLQANRISQPYETQPLLSEIRTSLEDFEARLTRYNTQLEVAQKSWGELRSALLSLTASFATPTSTEHTNHHSACGAQPAHSQKSAEVAKLGRTSDGVGMVASEQPSVPTLAQSKPSMGEKIREVGNLSSPVRRMPSRADRHSDEDVLASAK